MRVLYLHGLEETVSSPKPACLVNDKELDASCPELGIYFTKHNSPILSLLRTTSFGALVASSTALAFAFNNLAGLSTGTASLAAFACFAKSALRKHNPDVVVGFSWGGAIAVELIRNGDWQGSTVLLAPAHKLLDGFMQREMPIPALDATKTVVVHSTGDTLVPIAHSMELEQVAKVRLVRVASEPHKMWGIAADGLLQRLVREVA
eukprot:g1243.t1